MRRSAYIPSTSRRGSSTASLSAEAEVSTPTCQTSRLTLLNYGALLAQVLVGLYQARSGDDAAFGPLGDSVTEATEQVGLARLEEAYGGLAPALVIAGLTLSVSFGWLLRYCQPSQTLGRDALKALLPELSDTDLNTLIAKLRDYDSAPDGAPVELTLGEIARQVKFRLDLNPHQSAAQIVESLGTAFWQEVVLAQSDAQAALIVPDTFVATAISLLVQVPVAELMVEVLSPGFRPHYRHMLEAQPAPLRTWLSWDSWSQWLGPGAWRDSIRHSRLFRLVESISLSPDQRQSRSALARPLSERRVGRHLNRDWIALRGVADPETRALMRRIEQARDAGGAAWPIQSMWERVAAFEASGGSASQFPLEPPAATQTPSAASGTSAAASQSVELSLLRQMERHDAQAELVATGFQRPVTVSVWQDSANGVPSHQEEAGGSSEADDVWFDADDVWSDAADTMDPGLPHDQSETDVYGWYDALEQIAAQAVQGVAAWKDPLVWPMTDASPLQAPGDEHHATTEIPIAEPLHDQLTIMDTLRSRAPSVPTGTSVRPKTARFIQEVVALHDPGNLYQLDGETPVALDVMYSMPDGSQFGWVRCYYPLKYLVDHAWVQRLKAPETHDPSVAILDMELDFGNLPKPLATALAAGMSASYAPSVLPRSEGFRVHPRGNDYWRQAIQDANTMEVENFHGEQLRVVTVHTPLNATHDSTNTYFHSANQIASPGFAEAHGLAGKFWQVSTPYNSSAFNARLNATIARDYAPAHALPMADVDTTYHLNAITRSYALTAEQTGRIDVLHDVITFRFHAPPGQEAVPKKSEQYELLQGLTVLPQRLSTPGYRVEVVFPYAYDAAMIKALQKPLASPILAEDRLSHAYIWEFANFHKEALSTLGLKLTWDTEVQVQYDEIATQGSPAVRRKVRVPLLFIVNLSWQKVFKAEGPMPHRTNVEYRFALHEGLDTPAFLKELLAGRRPDYGPSGYQTKRWVYRELKRKYKLPAAAHVGQVVLVQVFGNPVTRKPQLLAQRNFLVEQVLTGEAHEWVKRELAAYRAERTGKAHYFWPTGYSTEFTDAARSKAVHERFNAGAKVVMKAVPHDLYSEQTVKPLNTAVVSPALGHPGLDPHRTPVVRLDGEIEYTQGSYVALERRRDALQDAQTTQQARLAAMANTTSQAREPLVNQLRIIEQDLVRLNDTLAAADAHKTYSAMEKEVEATQLSDFSQALIAQWNDVPEPSGVQGKLRNDALFEVLQFTGEGNETTTRAHYYSFEDVVKGAYLSRSTLHSHDVQLIAPPGATAGNMQSIKEMQAKAELFSMAQQGQSRERNARRMVEQSGGLKTLPRWMEDELNKEAKKAGYTHRLKLSDEVKVTQRKANIQMPGEDPRPMSDESQVTWTWGHVFSKALQLSWIDNPWPVAYVFHGPDKEIEERLYHRLLLRNPQVEAQNYYESLRHRSSLRAAFVDLFTATVGGHLQRHAMEQFYSVTLQGFPAMGVIGQKQGEKVIIRSLYSDRSFEFSSHQAVREEVQGEGSVFLRWLKNSLGQYERLALPKRGLKVAFTTQRNPAVYAALLFDLTLDALKRDADTVFKSNSELRWHLFVKEVSGVADYLSATAGAINPMLGYLMDAGILLVIASDRLVADTPDEEDESWKALAWSTAATVLPQVGVKVSGKVMGKVLHSAVFRRFMVSTSPDSFLRRAWHFYANPLLPADVMRSLLGPVGESSGASLVAEQFRRGMISSTRMKRMLLDSRRGVATSFYGATPMHVLDRPNLYQIPAGYRVVIMHDNVPLHFGMSVGKGKIISTHNAVLRKDLSADWSLLDLNDDRILQHNEEDGFRLSDHRSVKLLVDSEAPDFLREPVVQYHGLGGSTFDNEMAGYVAEGRAIHDRIRATPTTQPSNWLGSTRVYLKSKGFIKRRVRACQMLYENGDSRLHRLVIAEKHGITYAVDFDANEVGSPPMIVPLQKWETQVMLHYGDRTLVRYRDFKNTREAVQWYVPQRGLEEVMPGDKVLKHTTWSEAKLDDRWRYKDIPEGPNQALILVQGGRACNDHLPVGDRSITMISMALEDNGKPEIASWKDEAGEDDPPSTTTTTTTTTTSAPEIFPNYDDMPNPG